MASYYKKIIALEVNQPIGTFYITKFRAKDLLELSYPNPLRYSDKKDSSIELIGTQRGIDMKKLKEIGNYIDSVESTFPNSIILAANYTKEGHLVEDDSIRWKINKQNENDDLVEIEIPSDKKNASIIDGQHRLYAFNHIENDERLETELVCALFVDLPVQYQAYIFATINFNQKKVDKALAYEMYGYNLEDEDAHSWSPEKLGVYISRRLNTLFNAFQGHIIVAPQDDEILYRKSGIKKDRNWLISSATIVEGIIKLVSSNSKRDRDELLKHYLKNRKRKVLNEFKDNSPFRELYLLEKDLVIEKAIMNFFNQVEELGFFSGDGTILKKTVGIQALFNVLHFILKANFEKDKDIRGEYFKRYISKWKIINFNDPFFQFSGVGRTRIKNSLLVASELMKFTDLPERDKELYRRVLGR